MGNMAAYELFVKAVEATAAEAAARETTSEMGQSLLAALGKLSRLNAVLLPMLAKDPDLGLANATLYLDVFGRITASWIWLQQANIAAAKLAEEGALSVDDANFYQGKLQAARYYLEWELPEIDPQIALLESHNSVPFDMQDAWF